MAEYTKIGRIRPDYADVWDSARSYTALEVVKSADSYQAYIAKQDVPASTPLTDEAYWGVVLDVSDVIAESVAATNRANTAAEQADAAREAIKGDFEELSERTDQLSEEMDNYFEKSANILNPDAIIQNAYASPNGVHTSDSYSGWWASDLIPVNGESVLQCNVTLNSVIFYADETTINKTDSISTLNNAVEMPVTIPAGTAYIRVSGKMSIIGREIMLNYGDELLPYMAFGKSMLNNALLKINPVSASFNHMSTNGVFLSECKQALKKNVVVNYSENFDVFNYVLVGFTKSDNFSEDYTDYFMITNTSFTMRRKGYDDVTWEHGLTIDKYIAVEISFDIAHTFTVKIITIGGEYTKSNHIYLGGSYYPFATGSGSGFRNKKLSMTCKDMRRNVMIFGDSYVENGSTRWPYYLTDEVKDNLCFNGYAGESSASAIVDFRTLVKLGSPKFIVWLLGMNDGSDADDNTPSDRWLPHVQEVIETCERHNIIPILATIPSVPTINNRAKSAWVRASGYHYIDFAAAVNSDNVGNWYDGLLSSDGVHPSSAGAKVLCTRALADFPDMCVLN